MVVCASLAAACDAGAEPSVAPPTTTPASASAPTGEPAPGEPATWVLAPGENVQQASTTFTVLVTRLGCNGGVTGQVLAPALEKSASRIVVTFTVAAKEPGAAPCNGNNAVPYEVDLGEPVGERPVLDGECLPDEKGPKQYCAPDPVRFRA